jgi:nicotinate-nucleotide adenylyltransferase
LALSGNKKFKVSLIDVNRPGPHYTVDTLQHLAERFRRVEFYLILGSDSLNDMLTWHRPDEIVRQAHLAIVERPEHPANLSNIAEKMSSLLARIIQVPCPQIAISSSRIRENAAKGRTIRYLLPDRVRTYIHQHRLYQA